MENHCSGCESEYEIKKTRLGVRITLLYSVIYAGFVVLSVFRPIWMGRMALFGLNLAVFYGLGLIIIAVVFALVYNILCKPPKNHIADEPDKAENGAANQAPAENGKAGN